MLFSFPYIFRFHILYFYIFLVSSYYHPVLSRIPDESTAGQLLAVLVMASWSKQSTLGIPGGLGGDCYVAKQIIQDIYPSEV